MANVTVSTSDVAIGSGAVQVFSALSGEAFSAGAALCRVGTKLYQTDASDSTKVGFVGFALQQATGADEEISYVAIGEVVLGDGASSIMADWVWYVLSDTAGAICPVGDLATGETVVYVGYGVPDAGGSNYCYRLAVNHRPTFRTDP